ncbi:Beta-galactosidase [subsurface metagenome]
MKRLSLNGLWKYCLNDGEKYRDIQVPSNWYLRGLNHSGKVYYQKKFEISTQKDKDYYLIFKGVDYFCKVKLNGRLIGDHEGYFQEFSFYITDILKDGENLLEVEADSPRESVDIWPNKKCLIKGIFNHHDTRPGSWDPEYGQDRNTGGIWNGVLIMEKVKIHIDKNIKVSPLLLKDGRARLDIDIPLDNNDLSQEIKIKLEISGIGFKENFEINKKIFLSSGKNHIHLVKTLDKPKLWTTWDRGKSYLYNLRCKVLNLAKERLDEESTQFGIREIKIDDKWNWYLNGERFFPRGTNIIPTQWLSEYDKKMIAKDIEMLKEANVNAVRVHAHVNRQEFYDACDEAGILVWQDFPLQWSYEEADKFAQNAVSQIGDMIDQFYNHPSIVVWCCQNEPSVNRHTLDPLLYTTAKAKDSTRYIDIASDFAYHPYPGWYTSHYFEFHSLPAAPFINEFGAQALPNVETMREMMKEDELWPPRWSLWAYHDFQYDPTFNVAQIDMGSSLEEFIENSQGYQAKLLKYAIENYRKNKYSKVTGIFQFMFVDNWNAITWSVVDYFRRPKKGYDVLKTVYQPVLIGMDLDREKVGLDMLRATGFPGIWVVNDTLNLYENLHAKIILLRGREMLAEKEIGIGDVPANDVKRISYPPMLEESMKLNITERGIYTIEMELRDIKDNVISKNSYKIEVV